MIMSLNVWDSGTLVIMGGFNKQSEINYLTEALFFNAWSFITKNIKNQSIKSTKGVSENNTVAEIVNTWLKGEYMLLHQRTETLQRHYICCIRSPWSYWLLFRISCLMCHFKDDSKTHSKMRPTVI